MKIAFLFGALVTAFTFNSTSAFAKDAKNVVIGATVGDFSDMVKDSLMPQLEKKGYKVKLVQFTDYVQPNLALEQKAIDANIFQHKPYLDEFAKEKGLHLTAIGQVPTAPLGLYAGKKKALKDVVSGSTVAVPNDPTNLARALRILANQGWIELPQGLSLVNTTPRSITKNIKNIKIVQLEAAQLPRSLADVDFAVINGNYAISSGLRIDSALAQEKEDTYVNWVVVRSSDVASDFVKDLNLAIRSEEFKKYSKAKFKGYKLPTEWK